MTNNSNPLNGYRFDTREKGIETRGEQFAKLVNGSTASNQKADAKQDKEINKVSNDLADFKKKVYTKQQADAKFLTSKNLTPYAKKADVYTKAEVDAKIPPEQDLSSYAKIQYVDDQIAALIAGAPSELDTLKEAADAINANIGSIETISAGLDAKANAADVYNKSEVDSALGEKANAADLDAKANAADVYTKTEVDGLIPDVSGFAVASEVESALAEKANATDLDAKANAADVYTKTEVDGLIPDVSGKVDWVESTPGRKHIVLANHNNILGTDTEGGTFNLAMVSKWNVADFGSAQLHMNLNSVDGNVTINDDKQIATVDQLPDVTGFASKQELETLEGNVYTKTEVDGLIPDISGLAVASDVEAALAGKADVADLEEKADASAVTEEIAAAVAVLAAKDEAQDAEIALKANASEVYTKEEVDAMLAEKQAEIDALVADYKSLKSIVGDLGGDVEYNVPAEGKLTDLLKKSGTVKLSEDVTSSTFTGGITSKNVTTLNLNGKTLTFSGATTNNPGIMTRGKEEITIAGKGTLDAAGRIAVEANGVDSVINLSGTTGFFASEPTYVTDRSGGELIYCYLGTINISAGVFRNNGDDKSFTLNCYDANYRDGKANIIVTGGKFYDFDPANNTAEGPGTSFVPDGYESVPSTVEEDGVEHTVYTVKKIA